MQANNSKAFLLFTFLSALSLLVTEARAQTVKVFVLAGQSNMEGKAQNKLLDHQARDPKTKEHFAHLFAADAWIEREDAFIQFLDRRGPLTVGYGSPGRTGVELEFGTHMAEQCAEEILLIKAAWGGHSLFRNFRPPSAGLPADDFLQAEWERAVKRTEERNAKHGREEEPPTLEEIRAFYGSSYRNMLREVRTGMAEMGERFPALKGKRAELAGFVWFQGWNDQYEGAEEHYAENMRLFIEDVRRDLQAPKLPFVIGVMGQNGSKPAKGAMLKIQEAQLAMQELPAFRGNVRAVRTDELIDKAAEALYPEWKEKREEWERTGSDHPYHYLGSAIWHVRMGRAFAKAMLEMSAGAG